MNHAFDLSLAKGYKSGSQKARRLTEGWVSAQSYCPNCGQKKIEKYPNNAKAADFFCENCGEDYELKSKNGTFARKVIDGEYGTLMKRLGSEKNPNFLLLAYGNKPFAVKDYLVIPKHFFTPNVIEKREPLGPNAARAGWVGCNIDLGRIPESGRVFIIKDGRDVPQKEVLRNWKRTLFLREKMSMPEKGWALDVMRCVETLKMDAFSLDDMYGFEKHLTRLHPENNHVKDKIRQQLQVLRDSGYLAFLGAGKYKLRK